MKRVCDFFRKVYQCKISRIFFAVNLIGCAIYFDWNKAIQYYAKLNEYGCKPKPKLSGVSFGLYDMSAGTDLLEGLSLLVLCLLLMILSAIFLAPSMAVCGIILSILKSAHPALCDETIDLITVPIFMIVNGFYWTLLGRLIEVSHSNFLQNRPTRKNPLSIFSG